MSSPRYLLYLFILAVGLGAVSCASEETKQDEDRPNILFLFADDQRTDSIAALGNPVIQTPNIDRLFTEGFRFERAYCMGSMGGAVCVPSRAMLNSGRSLFRIRSDLEGIPVLGEILQKAGYTTFGTGKWHNQPPSFMRSFERGRAVFFGGMSDHTKVPLVDIDRGQMKNERVGDKFSSTLFADAAIEFLENYDFNKPFYAHVAFTAPHDPRQAPEGYVEMYDPATVPLPPNFMPQHRWNNGWMTGRDERLAGWPRTAETVRQQIAEYYGLITHMDHEIGRIVEALERTGQADNTIIIYSADHGLALGSHGLLGKQNLYEHSARAPLAFMGRDIPAGESSGALVYLFDIFTTICELTAADLPPGVEGRSLVPIWRRENGWIRESLFTAFADVMRAVVDERWKFIRYTQINRSQLFDLSEDPHEINNLAEDPEHKGRVEQMTALLKESQRKAGDDLPLTPENPQPTEIDLSAHARSPDKHQPAWIVKKYF